MTKSEQSMEIIQEVLDYLDNINNMVCIIN